MSGTSIHVFDWRGIWLEELQDIPYTCSWVMNDWRGKNNSTGQLKFKISFSDSKFSQKNLQKGNLVWIPSQYGLPDWFGVLDEPYNWGIKELFVQGYSADYILGWRAMPIGAKVQGTSGAQFASLLNYANQAQTDDITKKSFVGTQILQGNIFQGSKAADEKLDKDALTHARNIATNNQRSFDVTGKIDSNGRLLLYGNWYLQQGIMCPYAITDSYLGEDIKLNEQGEIANCAIGQGDATSSGTRNTSTVIDEASVNLYGLRSFNFTNLGVSGPAAVYNATVAKLNQGKQPLMPFSPEILYPGAGDPFPNLFPYMAIGNQFNIDINTGGFRPDGTVGLQDVYYIIEQTYDSLTNTANPVFDKYVAPSS